MLEDIVHGDVKCENVLIFERKNQLQEQYDKSKIPRDFAAKFLLTRSDNFNLTCKLTDFGVSRHPDGGVILGGSRPWQAPECSRGEYFKIEAAKRTDVYSFGMLLWRVMLDGDPFKSLGEFAAGTAKDKRQLRNDAVASLKKDDRLVQHVCSSLALSESFSRLQLEMLCDVINITLVQDAQRRELDMARIIRLLTPNNWYEGRHPVAPERVPTNIDAQLLDVEKWYSELEMASQVVQSLIAKGYKDYAQGRSGQLEVGYEAKRSAAAYQLAICYGNGFGVPFQPDQCLKWLKFAVETGSQKAHEALPKVARAFDAHPDDYVNVSSKVNHGDSLLSSSWTSDFSMEGGSSGSFRPGNGTDHVEVRNPRSTVSVGPSWTLLNAAESCRYDILDSLLLSSVKPSMSEDGVSPIHFLSSWDVRKAENLGRRLVLAGADINARAKRGHTVGGTPLMWSVYGDHLEHSSILIKLGADPMASSDDGADALSFAAKLHLAAQLRLLLENVRPAQIRDQIGRLIEAAAGGESRFTRIVRHGERWKSAATETLQLLQLWNSLFEDANQFNALLLPAIHSSLKTPYGRMNTDVQVGFIRSNAIDSSRMVYLLRDSVLTYNQKLFEALLDYHVPITGIFERKKSLLHLCAKIPDHNLAATAFAPRLLALGAEVEARDENGITPWMDAILERKWDLADLLMENDAKALTTDKDGFNVLGLCIKAANLGSIKYLLKYCAAKLQFHHDSFLVNREKQISALQLASTLPLPRAHGMKLEVMGCFLIILTNYGREPWQLNFQSDALLPGATALEIAAAKGNIHPVKNIVKNGADMESRNRAVGRARASLSVATDPMQRKNLERCIFIIENWDDSSKQTRKLADDWTNMRTIDESHVKSSWEIVVFDYKSRKGMSKKIKEEQKEQSLSSS